MKTINGILLVMALGIPGQLFAADKLLSDAELVTALRAGGHSLYFRHVATDWSLHDQVEQPGDWRDCDPGRMRQLSAEGRADARRIGDALRQLGVPVGEVLASPYCRTVETASLMAIGEVVETMAVMNLRSASYVGGRASVVATARALLTTRPGTGNRVIVAHGNVAREATPVYPGEGEMVVFTADGEGGFVLRGRVAVADWPRLLSIESQ